MDDLLYARVSRGDSRLWQFCVLLQRAAFAAKTPLTKEDEKTRRQHAKQREKFRIDAGSPAADEPEACGERAVLASAEHQEIRSVDVVDHRTVIIVARGVDHGQPDSPLVATKRKPFFGAGIQGKVRGVAEPRLPVLRARHFEDYENWEPDFRESRARRAPPHAASAPEQSRAEWTRRRLGNEFRIRGSWSR